MATIAAVTADGARSTLSDADIESLRSALRGEVIPSDHGSYEAARRVWNGNIDRRPALIARCAGVADVQQAVNFARTPRLLVSVRGGGHSAPGYGTNDGGLVIDLSPMKGIRVDPVARTVRAQGGVLWRELDHETQAFGLATTGGTVSNTGIAGLTLGGGLGWLMGKHGLTVDNLISADVVTADGQFRRASATENPDLFWALRGGGGNFGVVTSFEYRLHPVTQVLGGLVIYPLDQAREVLRFYRDFCPDAARRGGGLRRAAHLARGDAGRGADPRLQRADRGRREGPGSGAPVRAARRRPRRADALPRAPDDAGRAQRDARPAPLLALGLHGADLGRGDRRAGGRRGAASALRSARCSSSTCTAPRRACRRPRPPSRRAGPSGTSMPSGSGRTGPQSAQHIAWVRALWSRLEPHLQGSAYVNHLAEDDRPEKVRASFGQNYGRLRQLKAVYDPTNLFRINANIAPAG